MKVNWYDMNDSIRRRRHRDKATNQRDRDRDISREKENCECISVNTTYVLYHFRIAFIVKIY